MALNYGFQYDADHPVSDVLSCTLLWDSCGALVIMLIILCQMFCPLLYCGTYMEPWWSCRASCVQCSVLYSTVRLMLSPDDHADHPVSDVLSCTLLLHLGKQSRKKICFNLDIVQRGGGGPTQIQIVQGTIKKIAFFSGKVPRRCPRRQGGGQGDFDNV